MHCKQIKWKCLLLSLLFFPFCGLMAQEQGRTIRVVGQVLEPSGVPAVGVTIMVKGTTQGTITDIDGNYMISAPENGTLQFSYVGFTDQEIPVNGQTTIDVKLVESENVLEEVVISVGYGAQRKMTTIGAQSGITNVAELKQPVSNLTNVIAGRVSGVIGMQRSGDPGNDNAELWIRGISTFTNSEPLILVDGVERDMANINAEDIESFQVLKDASATAVYGVKGANGVIMITTKQGVKGKPKVSVEYNYGLKDFTKVPDFADGVTYMQMANEALVSRGEMPLYSEEQIRKTYTQEDPMLYPNVNWMDEIFQKFGSTQNVNVNVNGGSEFAQYYVSVGYMDETGMYKITPIGNSTRVHDGSVKYKRYNFTSNLTMQVTRTTEVKLGLKGYQSTRVGPHYSAQEVFQEALNTYPIWYPAEFYDGDKLPFKSSGGGMDHPYGMLTQYGVRTENKFQTFADLRIKQKLDMITEGLSIQGMFSFDNYSYNRLKRYRTPKTYYATGRDDDGNLILERQDNNSGVDYLSSSEVAYEGNRRYYLEASINYERLFAGAHRVSAMFLYNHSDYALLHEANIIKANPYRSQGIAGRATYSYMDRYLFEANFGYNGSENFHPDKRFGFFPSVGLGWVVSNENFYGEGLKRVLPFLKLRASWGQAGNDKLLSDNYERRYAYYATVGSGNGGYTYGKNGGMTTSYGGQAIEEYAVNVTWETSTKANLGLDMRLFDEALMLQFDVFTDRRTNIFLQRQSVPDYIGLRKQDWGNLGIIDNRGIEATLDFNKQFGNWYVGLKGNFTFTQSEIVEDDSPAKPYPWLETRGQSVKHRFGYVFSGFYTEDEIQTLRDEYDKPAEERTLAIPTDFDPASNNYLAGDLKYEDLNGDKIIDTNDRKVIGRDQVPQIVYGFGATVGWKGFSLGAFFQGVGLCDFTIMDPSSDYLVPYKKGTTNGNVYADIVNRWTPENQGEGAIYPRLSHGGVYNMNYEVSTFWLRSGAFLRLKTLDFGYTFPNKWTEKFGVNDLRLYFLGNNLLTFTDFTRYDVELGGGADAVGKYPNTRTFSFGLKFGF